MMQGEKQVIKLSVCNDNYDDCYDDFCDECFVSHGLCLYVEPARLLHSHMNVSNEDRNQ